MGNEIMVFYHLFNNYIRHISIGFEEWEYGRCILKWFVFCIVGLVFNK